MTLNKFVDANPTVDTDNNKPLVKVLDSTLREGEQTPGVYFSIEQKLAIAQHLDEIGVDIIEVGNPVVDSDIEEAIRKIARAGLRAKIGAHARCRKDDVSRAIDCGVDFLGVFLNVSDQRLKRDYRLALNGAIAQVEEVISYARSQNPNLIIRYTPEDAMRSPLGNVVRAAVAATQAGANVISIADTTGYAHPFIAEQKISKVVAALKVELAKCGLNPWIAAHCHNDRGLALTNALDACTAGAELIDTAVLGLGERAGIVDLAALLINLKDAFACPTEWNFAALKKLYDLVSQYSGKCLPHTYPLVGRDVFTHYSGVHVNSVNKDPDSYLSINPHRLGRDWDFALGMQSGATSIQLALKKIGRDDLMGNTEIVSQLLKEIKALVKKGKLIEIDETFVQLVRNVEALFQETNTMVADPAVTSPALGPIGDRIVKVPAPDSFVRFERSAIEQSIAQRFEQQVKLYPHHLAVKTRQQQLTYAELDRAANRLANAILSIRGEGSEPIALLFEHSTEMIVGILGVLKAGKFYVPLSPAHPVTRNVGILEDCNVQLLLTNDRSLAVAKDLSLPQIQVINLDHLGSGVSERRPRVSISPEQPAYLIYTSGSTGQPKGVLHLQQNVLHNMMKYTNGICISPSDRLLLLASYTYTASTSGIFGALLNGAALLPFNLKEEGLHRLADWLLQQKITIYHSVPTVFRHFVQMLSNQNFPDLRLIKLGGETVIRRDVDLYKQHFSDQCILHTGFGSTEMPVARQFFFDKQTEFSGSNAPSGYALEDTEILLLDETGQGLPPGNIGEIAIKSSYLFQGYWQKNQLNQTVFLPTSSNSKERIFCTGDLGYITPAGCLIHLGRKDFQIKIRGQRVEVAEIELALLDIDGIKEAVVVPQEDQNGEKQLVAYLVTQPQGTVNSSQIQNWLLDKLPEFMIPAAFIEVEKMPVTTTGKVDRRALPAIAPQQKQLQRQTATVATEALDEIEKQLIAIWQELLNLPSIDLRDNFFDLGGHSLLAMRLLAQVESKFGKAVSLSTLYKAPTVEKLASILRQDDWSNPCPSLMVIQPGMDRPPLFCIHILGRGLKFYRPLAKRLGPEQPLYGLSIHLLERDDMPENQVETQAAYYIKEMRMIQPEGPYHLIGMSFGGKIAFEMARQLEIQGQKVASVVLLDTYAPGAVKDNGEIERISGHWKNVQHHGLPYIAEKVGARLRSTSLHITQSTETLIKQWQCDYRNRLGLPLPDELQDFLFSQQHQLASRNYQPKMYSGKITLFRAMQYEKGISETIDPYLGWGQFTTGGVEVYHVPGDHLSMVEEPNVQYLAASLKTILNRDPKETLAPKVHALP
jgi:amino acid adenylation domain-containing protein